MPRHQSCVDHLLEPHGWATPRVVTSVSNAFSSSGSITISRVHFRGMTGTGPARVALPRRGLEGARRAYLAKDADGTGGRVSQRAAHSTSVGPGVLFHGSATQCECGQAAYRPEIPHAPRLGCPRPHARARARPRARPRQIAQTNGNVGRVQAANQISPPLLVDYRSACYSSTALGRLAGRLLV